MCFFPAVAVGFFHLINERNLSPILQRSRRMSCRPNPSPDSAKVWLLHLPIEPSLHIFTFHPRFIYYFQPRFSFHFRPVYFSPTHKTTVLPTIHNLLICVCFVSPIPLCSAPTSTFTYACAQNHSRKTQIFLWHMFQIHVAP